MAISFGPPRRVLPPSNLGMSEVAQRRIVEAAGRASERTRIAIAPDSHQCRVWLRNPRSTIPCPCSAKHDSSPSGNPVGDVRVSIHMNEGDMLEAIDAGFPIAPLQPAAGEDQPPDSVIPPEGNPSWLEDVARLLLGNGKRCGLCLGNGWLNGYHLYGGVRIICCVADTDYAILTDDTGPLVDVDSPTPTFVGPGSVTWTVNIPTYTRQIDALRVRDGLSPATGMYVLEASTNYNPYWRDASIVLGCADGTGYSGAYITDESMSGLQLRLTLGRGVRASHVELFLRSEPLVNLQLPQLQQAASQELVSPFISTEFELSPEVGNIERGSLFEVPGVSGRIGAVYVVTDIQVKQTAKGLIWGITGNVRAAQPTDVVACALLDDTLSIGLIDGGTSTRGLEANESGQPGGLAGQTDDSLAAAKRGSSKRIGGGSADANVPIATNIRGNTYEDLP